MSSRRYCDRCKDELFEGPTLHVRASYGAEMWDLCERCCVSLRTWIESRPYTLLPDGAPEPLKPIADALHGGES